MDTFKNVPIWYDMMIWYDMIWYDMIMRYVMEYGMKYDMRYDVIWDHMMWRMSDMEWYDVIYTVGKKGKLAVIPLTLSFLHTVCYVWCVASVCVCVCLMVGGCGVSKTVHGHFGSFNLFKCHHRGDVWIIPYLIRGNMLHIEHISCVITDCDQHQWVIPFPPSISLLCLAGVNQYQRITIVRIVFQKLALPGAFFVFFLLSFPLTFVWLVCYCSLRLYFSPGNYS